MDDNNNNEGSLLEKFQDPPQEEIVASEASPDLSFTLPEEPSNLVEPQDSAIVPEPEAAPVIDSLPGEELSEPAESVNQMLGEAIFNEESSTPSAPAQETPVEYEASYSLSIHGPVEPNTWNHALQLVSLKPLNLPKEPPKRPFLISRLNDYQAIAATIALKSLNIATELVSTSKAETTSDLSSEGSPNVTLPKNAKDVLLYTGDLPSGYTIQAMEGVVSAHRAIARRFFRDLEAQDILEHELEKLQKASKIRKLFPASAMERLFNGLFLDLQKAALSRGANGVVGLRVEIFPESNNLEADLEQIRLVALGTLAVVEKV